MTEEQQKQYEERVIERFTTMEPFNTDNTDDFYITVPVVSEDIFNNVVIPNLIRCGAIPKDKLIKDREYLGHCRNSGKAKWDGEKFVYQRYKFGSYYEDDVPTFEDGVNNDTDVFVPIKLVNDEK